MGDKKRDVVLDEVMNDAALGAYGSNTRNPSK